MQHDRQEARGRRAARAAGGRRRARAARRRGRSCRPAGAGGGRRRIGSEPCAQPTTSEREPPSAAATAGQHVGEEMVALVQLLGARAAPSARLASRPGPSAASSCSASSQCCREPALGVVRRGAGGDDELPVGRLGQQQLARRLGQHRARGRATPARPAPTSQNACSSGQSRSQVHAVSVAEPHAEVAVGAPGAPRAAGWPARGGCCLRGGAEPVAGWTRRAAAGERAVHVAEKVGALEPPVPEELGVERRHDHALAVLRLARPRCRPSSRAKCSACPRARAAAALGVVGLLVAQVDAGAGHPPELEAAGPAHLVELEIRTVAGIALEPAPDLHRGARDRARTRRPTGAVGATR